MNRADRELRRAIRRHGPQPCKTAPVLCPRTGCRAMVAYARHNHSRTAPDLPQLNARNLCVESTASGQPLVSRPARSGTTILSTARATA